MNKPAKHFKGYILTLIGDREYEKSWSQLLRQKNHLPKPHLFPLICHNCKIMTPVTPFLPPMVIPPCPHIKMPSSYYPPSHPGPGHCRGYCPSIPSFLGKSKHCRSGNKSLYCYFCGGSHRRVNCYKSFHPQHFAMGPLQTLGCVSIIQA